MTPFVALIFPPLGKIDYFPLILLLILSAYSSAGKQWLPALWLYRAQLATWLR